jgi:hypothetical protein
VRAGSPPSAAGSTSSIVPSSAGVLADLDLRIDPRLELAIDLQDSVFIDQRRAVRLLGADRANRRRRRQDRLVEGGGAAEMDLADIGAVNLVRADRAHRVQHEIGAHHRVDDGAVAAEPAGLGKLEGKQSGIARIGVPDCR